MQTNIVHLINGSQRQCRFDKTERRIINWGVKEHAVRPTERNGVSDSSEAQGVCSPLGDNRANCVVFNGISVITAAAPEAAGSGISAMGNPAHCYPAVPPSAEDSWEDSWGDKAG